MINVGRPPIVTGYGHEHVTGSRPAMSPASAIMLFVAMFFLLPGSLLPSIGWHYFGGGPEFQKLHPATYLLVAVFPLALIVDGAFRRRCMVQLTTDYAFVAFGIAALATSLFAIVARGASAANLIETFALALIVRLSIVAMPRGPMIWFRRFIDLLFIVGVVTVLGEFVLRRSIIFENVAFYDPITQQIVTTEFRAAGIFGHPLAAAGFFALYAILNLVSTPMRLTIGCMTRLLLSALAFLAIFPTGGRSGLLVGGLIMAAFVALAAFRSLARGSFSKAGLVWFVLFLTCVILMLPVMYHFDVFDTMLARFARDDGSTLSREYALQILLESRPEDLWFGMPLADVVNLQRQFGLVAIENGWINFALICGLVFTIPLLVSYLLFMFKSNPRYCTSGIYYVALLQLILSNATNDLWAKNTAFATGLAVIFAFLRKDLAVPQEEPRAYALRKAPVGRHAVSRHSARMIGHPAGAQRFGER